LICIEAYNRKSRWREVLINGHVISNVLQCKKTRFSTVLSSRLWSYGAFTHTLRWDGMGCAFYGNSMYFNGGVHTSSYQCSLSHPIPPQLFSLAVSKVTGYSSLQQAPPIWELTCHMGSHSVTCHPAEVTFPPLLQPIKAG